MFYPKEYLKNRPMSQITELFRINQKYPNVRKDILTVDEE